MFSLISIIVAFFNRDLIIFNLVIFQLFFRQQLDRFCCFKHNHENKTEVNDCKDSNDNILPQRKTTFENDNEVRNEKSDSKDSGKIIFSVSNGKFSHDVFVVGKFDKWEQSER